MTLLLNHYTETADILTATPPPNVSLWWQHFRDEIFDCFQKRFFTPDDLIEIEEHTPEGPLVFRS